jgi:hypothetical protein
MSKWSKTEIQDSDCFTALSSFNLQRSEPVLFSVRGPALFGHLHLFGRRDAEAPERQDHGPDGDVGFGGFSDMPAPRALNHRRTDVAFRPNPVQHGVRLAAQLNQLGHRQARLPPGPKDLRHFRKPSSLRVTSGHPRSILTPCRPTALFRHRHTSGSSRVSLHRGPIFGRRPGRVRTSDAARFRLP